jgi:rubrerythrin
MAGQDTVIKVFEYALNQEETGKSFFQSSLKRLGVGAAVSAFERLIREEEGHIRFIHGILKNLKEESDLNLVELKELAMEPTNYFDQRARSEFLEQCVRDAMVPDVAVFNTAWLIEKDLSEFYEKMAGHAVGKAKQCLLLLSRWERGHELFFREYRDKLDDTYSRMPWGG